MPQRNFGPCFLKVLNVNMMFKWLTLSPDSRPFVSMSPFKGQVKSRFYPKLGFLEPVAHETTAVESRKAFQSQ